MVIILYNVIKRMKNINIITDSEKNFFYDSKSLEVQSILFDKDKYSVDEARAWLKSHNKRYDKVDTTENKYRFRQFNPDLCDKGSFRTEEITSGIQFIYCKKT